MLNYKTVIGILVLKISLLNWPAQLGSIHYFSHASLAHLHSMNPSVSFCLSVILLYLVCTSWLYFSNSRGSNSVFCDRHHIGIHCAEWSYSLPSPITLPLLQYLYALHNPYHIFLRKRTGISIRIKQRHTLSTTRVSGMATFITPHQRIGGSHFTRYSSTDL